MPSLELRINGSDVALNITLPFHVQEGTSFQWSMKKTGAFSSLFLQHAEPRSSAYWLDTERLDSRREADLQEENVRVFSQSIIHNKGIGCFFLTGPPLSLLIVGWKVTDFKKLLRVPDWPHLMIEKCFGAKQFSFVEDLEGGQSRDLWGGPV